MSDILSEIKAFKELTNVSDESLKWLISIGDVTEYPTNEHLFQKGEKADHLYMILGGCIKFYGLLGDQQREFNRLGKGTITGVLPYSRLEITTGNGQFLEPTRVFLVHRKHFPEMITHYHDLTTAFVHFMTTRVRSFTTLRQQNEKLASLGKLSAGLAHELNNPASAIVRSAQELQKHLKLLPEGFKAVIKIKMNEEQVDCVNELMFKKMEAGFNGDLSLTDKMEMEEEILDWLEDHEVEDAEEIADNLVDFGFTEEDLEMIYENTGEAYFPPVIGWIHNNLTTEKMVQEISEASSRIGDLVSSVKSYTHMDQSRDRQKVDLHHGIRSTLRMLQFKIKKAQIKVVEAFDPHLEEILGYPGELNQIWTNLIDNALDAMSESDSPTLEVRTVQEKGRVLVSIIDSGTGIPAEIKSRIFDPFYTTKGIGQGTGLGLDVVAKIVEQHHGNIEVDSEPGRTEFKLMLPVE